MELAATHQPKVLNLTKLGFRVKELIGGKWWKRDGTDGSPSREFPAAGCGVTLYRTWCGCSLLSAYCLEQKEAA
jgi:hypothetical protein